MGFVGDDGEFTGFDLEMAAEVAKRLNLTIAYQPIAWDAKLMICLSFQRTESRCWMPGL